MGRFGSLVLVMLLIYGAHSRYTHNSDSRDYFSIKLSVGNNRYQIDGSIAGYSNVSFARLSGPLYNANENFGCASNNNYSTITPPFVLFAPLSDNCDDLEKANAAQRIGAAAVIFYTSDSNMQFISRRITDLKVAVTRIFVPPSSSIANALKKGSSEEPRPVSIDGSSVQATLLLLRTQETSRVFYFVVFAFTLLIVLSLSWFIVSYTKRMVSQCADRRKRVAAQQFSRKVIIKLPTRTIKTAKAQKGEEDVVCAVCLDIFAYRDCIRTLPCKHEFHKRCVDPWLQSKSTCPLCKYNIVSGRGQSCPTATVAVTSPFVNTHWSQREQPAVVTGDNASTRENTEERENEELPAAEVIGDHSNVVVDMV